MPWPVFEGWEEALPVVVGTADQEMGGYCVDRSVADAIAYLRRYAAGEKVTGLWSDAVALLGA